jgi:hypothetical protein
LKKDFFNKFSFFFFFSCRLTLNHPRSASPTANILAAQQEKMLHAVQTPVDEDEIVNHQMGTNAV